MAKGCQADLLVEKLLHRCVHPHGGCIPARRLKPLPRLPALPLYTLTRIYSVEHTKKSGDCVPNHCGAEPPRDIEPPRLVTTVGWRDRASTSYGTADRVKAPASAARGRFRRIHGGRA